MMTDVTMDPTALFGMLLAAEGGASLDQMAHVYDMPRHEVLDLLGKARRGECARIEASSGDSRATLVSGRGAGPIASEREEVLVQRWMRRIARHLHRHGAVTARELRDYLGEGREQHASISLDALRQQFKTLGMRFVDNPRKGTLPARLELDFDSQQTLAAIIADDWKIEVER